MDELQGEWSEDKQKKYENAIEAFTHSHGRAPSEDEINELWNLIAYPDFEFTKGDQ